MEQVFKKINNNNNSNNNNNNLSVFQWSTGDWFSVAIVAVLIIIIIIIIKELQKTAILGTAHILRKVLM